MFSTDQNKLKSLSSLVPVASGKNGSNNPDDPVIYYGSMVDGAIRCASYIWGDFVVSSGIPM